MAVSDILRQFHGDIVAAQQHIREELQKQKTRRLNYITYLTNNAYNNISEATVKEYYKEYPEDTEKAFRAHLQKIEVEERKNNETGNNISLKRSKSKKNNNKFGREASTKKEGYRQTYTKLESTGSCTRDSYL